MARTYKNPSIVSGKSIQDIMDIDIHDFNKLSKKDLQIMTGRLVSAANKRLRNFEKLETESPATRYIMKHGGRFSTRGKTLNQLRSEFVRAKWFLQSETGTIKGWERVQDNTIKTLSAGGVHITREEFGTFWKSMEELKDLKGYADKEYRYVLMEFVTQSMTEHPDWTAKDISDNIKKQIEKAKAKENGKDPIEEVLDERRRGDVGTSSFFESTYQF